jgi:hypothetical protein
MRHHARGDPQRCGSICTEVVFGGTLMLVDTKKQ